MRETWQRIHDWLKIHSPKLLESLNPGATDKAIASAEQALGMPMPAGWRSLYRAHDGMNQDANFGSLFHGMNFLTLERVVADHAQNVAQVYPLPNQHPCGP